MKPHLLCVALLVQLAATSWAADDDGFVSLFNGRDLAGWINVNCAPETWTVSDGVIHCTGHPTGALRTPRQYENFVLELEWRHLSSGGNSGVFIWASPIAAPGVPFLRAIEVQVLDHGFNVQGKNQWYTTHGDVFPIHGATMKPFGRHNGMRSFPSEERSKGSPEWNHYKIVCDRGVIRLHVNGKEVSGGEDCNYRKGYIGLESEGAPVEFRNIRIKELPPTGASPDVTAPLDEGWRSLFTGLDLRGWRTNEATAKRWRAEGEHLRLLSGPAGDGATLWSELPFGNAQFVIDLRPPKSPEGKPSAAPVLFLRGGQGLDKGIVLRHATPDKYQRFVITVKGDKVTVQSDAATDDFTLPSGGPSRGSLGLSAVEGAIEFMNIYFRELKD